MAEQILALLAKEHMTAADLRAHLQMTHERIYAALVHLEALGRVEVWVKRKHDSRGEVVWREVIA